MINGRLPWMYRTHEDYDPNEIGAISQVKVIAAVVEAGANVLLPWVQVARYDLVVEWKGRFLRVQCKTGQIFRGAISFRPQSLRAAKRETEWRRIVYRYDGEIDVFGVYCPDNGKVYLVPIADGNTHGTCFLRLDPPKNNQRKRIRWAADFEVIPGQPPRAFEK
jgi:PD-(D/E)XK endonuclease